MSFTNLHIYPSPFRYESRILKETKSLIDNNLVNKIIIASTWDNGLLKFEKIDDYRFIKRFNLLSNNFNKFVFFKLFLYFEFTIKVFFEYRKVKLEYINCHSLLVLPIGVLLKKVGLANKLIYDAHELETERNGLTSFSRIITKFLERFLINYVDFVIVVNEPIADWYKKKYNINEVFVVKNMPKRIELPTSKSSLLKNKFNIPKNQILFIYQGLLIKGRGIENLIEVFSKAPKDKHVVFMGYGPFENIVKKYASINANIHFHPAVLPSDIVAYTSSADIGLHFIIGKLCLSYKYSLPNKFGEYLLAGIPVLVSSSLEYLSSIVTKEECGWSISSENNDSLLSFITNIDKYTIDKVTENVNLYNKNIGWEFEEIIFFKIYK
jgi:hypothetical protein